MLYFSLAIAAVVIIYFKFKKKTAKNDQFSVASFRQWFSEYQSASPAQQSMLAASFINQTFHLAKNLQAIPEVDELFSELRQHDVKPIVDEWLEHSLPNVIDVVGELKTLDSEARLVGVLMLVGNADLRPERGIRNLLSKLAR